MQQRPQDPLIFVNSYTLAHITVHSGMSWGDEMDRERFLLCNRNSSIPVKFKLLQEAWAPSLSKEIDINRYASFFCSSLPPETKNPELSFDLVKALNNLQPHLPQDFFLRHDGGLDTALSQAGLIHLSQAFSASHGLPCQVFSSEDELKTMFPEMMTLLETQGQLALLANLEDSKRHITGFFAKKNLATYDLYIFDTTGITLPAWPCGYNYSVGIFSPLIKVMHFFQEQGLRLHIMPISSIRTLQKDKFSCLMASILFFEAMLANEYSSLDNLGLIEAYAPPTKYIYKVHQDESWSLIPAHGLKSVPVALFTLSSLPFLVGIQDQLSLMLIANELEAINDIYPQLLKYRNEWKRQYGLVTIDGFWPYAYLQLLNWLGRAHELRFPNFKQLVEQGLDSKAIIKAMQAQFKTWNQNPKTKNSSLIQFLATADLTQAESIKQLVHMAKLRQHRNASKFNGLWFPGRDTSIVQPIYDEIVRRQADFKFDHDFLHFLNHLQPKLTSTKNIHPSRVSSFLQDFANIMEKNLRASSGMRSIVKKIKSQGKDIQAQEIEDYMKQIASQRCQRTWSKLSIFGQGRDTEIIQPLYDLMAKPNFKLNLNSITEFEKILSKIGDKPSLSMS